MREVLITGGTGRVLASSCHALSLFALNLRYPADVLVLACVSREALALANAASVERFVTELNTADAATMSGWVEHVLQRECESWRRWPKRFDEECRACFFWNETRGQIQSRWETFTQRTIAASGLPKNTSAARGTHTRLRVVPDDSGFGGQVVVRRVKPDAPCSKVYFYQCPLSQRIKVGTSYSPLDRPGAMNPTRLELLGCIEGGIGVEGQIKRLFAEWRVFDTHGKEWFEFDGFAAEFVARLVDAP